LRVDIELNATLCEPAGMTNTPLVLGLVGRNAAPDAPVGLVVVGLADLHAVHDDVVLFYAQGRHKRMVSMRDRRKKLSKLEDTNLLGLVSRVYNGQLDGEVVVERGKVIIASLINIDIRPRLLGVLRASCGRRDVLVGTPPLHLVENGRVGGDFI
jgi:hypothetical protein